MPFRRVLLTAPSQGLTPGLTGLLAKATFSGRLQPGPAHLRHRGRLKYPASHFCPAILSSRDKFAEPGKP
jgi:hypothetical protein